MTSGTPKASATHTRPWGPIGFMLSMLPPVLLITIGITTEGLGAISWAGAIVWGIAATIVFTVFSLMGKATGMSRMDLLDLLGSAFVAPGTSAAKMLGAIIHHMNGAILAVAWAYGAALLNVTADWISAAIWGVILWALALLMMTTIGSVHPAIRDGRQDDPGPAATNFGKMTPVGSLMGHLVYGIVLGLTYSAWPPPSEIADGLAQTVGAVILVALSETLTAAQLLAVETESNQRERRPIQMTALDEGEAGVIRARQISRMGLVLAAAAVLLAACGGDDDGETINVESAAALATVTEDALPPGFEPNPMVELDGKQWEFDTIPGHYWKVLDNGYAVGLHFQSEDPFRWAKDAEDNELLYVVYAMPGNCPAGNFDKSVTQDDVSAVGGVLPGFDHWHGVIGAGPKQGHWLMHMPVRDFVLEGPPGNPMDGEEITAGIPEFMPICEPR